MKSLINLLVLLLAAPSLAFGVTTVGSITTDGGEIGFVEGSVSVFASGDNCTPCGNFSLNPGESFRFLVSDNLFYGGGTGSMGVTGGGLVTPFDASGLVMILAESGPITGPGVYHGIFDFEGQVDVAPLSDYEAHPTWGCFTAGGNLPCTFDFFQLSGTVTLDVVRAQDGLLSIEEPANLTIGAPEPSTSPLLLVGFAGLVVLRRRRRSRATLPA
jgi:hypothetical protein